MAVEFDSRGDGTVGAFQQEPKSINPNPYFNSHGLKAQEAVTNLVHILEPFTEQATVQQNFTNYDIMDLLRGDKKLCAGFLPYHSLKTTT